MKKTRFILTSLFIIAALVSCSKKPRDNFAQLITPSGIEAIAIANNGGNVTCEEVALATDCDFEQSSGRIDYDGGSGGTYGPITWTTDGTYVNWTSTVPVKIAVIVKGGPNASVYFSGCDECFTNGTGLTAPINPHNGKPYGLSNITFCYSVCPPEEILITLKSMFHNSSDTQFWGVSAGEEIEDGGCLWSMGSNIYQFGTNAIYNLVDLWNSSINHGTITITNDDEYLYVDVMVTDITYRFDYTHVYAGSSEGLQNYIGECVNHAQFPFLNNTASDNNHHYLQILLSDINE